MARPSKDVDITKLKALMRLKPTLEDTAAFFEVSDRTIERVIRKHFKVSFVEFRDQNMVHTRLNIVRKAIQKAEGGDNTMLIFCLKNLCQWRDKQPDEDQPGQVNVSTTTVVASDDQLKTLVDYAKGKK